MKPLSTNGLATIYEGADQPRRALIAWCAAACAPSAVFAPLASLAQQPAKVWRIGFLSLRSRPASFDNDVYGGFIKGFRELGYTEGTNLSIEWRFADGDATRLAGLAAGLAQMNLDVVLTPGPQASVAAKNAIRATPVVMVVSSDPVAAGLVASLARPGGNVTGLANYSADLGSKHLQMISEMVPKLKRVALLGNPSNVGNAQMLTNVEAAAQKIGIKVLPVYAQALPQLEQAFVTMKREKAGAVIVALDAFFVQQWRQIAALADKHRMPSIAPDKDYVQFGGLISYGGNIFEQYRRTATYADKIFKGTKPADLPVEQPTTFELLINGKTAKALKLTIPQSLLISADKVIE